jgi:Xaa-Pro aminopeptidase
MLQQRVEKMRQILQEKNLDGFLISNFYNILYVTGFKTLTDNEREGWALITKKNVYLFTDSRYFINNKSLILKSITPEKGLIKHLIEIVEEEKIQKLGFEGDDLKVSELNRLIEFITNINFVPLERLVIKIREVKDAEEIGSLKKACKIADKCLEEIVKTIKIGTSEKEIAFKIEFWLKEKNYDLSFYPIVAVDKNSSIPHYDTRSGNNEKVKINSIILIDYGAKFDGYHSDTTRMIFTGKPTDEMVNTYQILLGAQEKTIKQLEIDNNPVSVDQYCRKLISNQGLPIYEHSTGHGVGLQIHEFPKVSFTSTDVLLPDQVITVEPGVYLGGKWGMRIEDTILVKDKQVEILTKFNKKILILSF